MTQAFNLSQLANKVNTSGQADLTTAVTGTLPVANGGTGAATLTANNVLLGNGTSALQVVAPSTNGNVLTSNGTTWVSAAAPSSAPTTAQVLSATAGASAGAVGTYAYLGSSSGVSGLLVGTNYAGSSLLYAGVSIGTNGNYVTNNVNTISDGDSSTSVSGTWKCMGSCYYYGSGGLNRGRSTLFLRVA